MSRWLNPHGTPCASSAMLARPSRCSPPSSRKKIEVSGGSSATHSWKLGTPKTNIDPCQNGPVQWLATDHISSRSTSAIGSMSVASHKEGPQNYFNTTGLFKSGGKQIEELLGLSDQDPPGMVKFEHDGGRSSQRRLRDEDVAIPPTNDLSTTRAVSRQALMWASVPGHGGPAPATARSSG
jgi:hypothetical protein